MIDVTPQEIAAHAATLLAEAAARALVLPDPTLARLETHERVCAERWKNCYDTMSDIKTSLRGFQSQLWFAAGLVVTTLLGTVGFLASKVIH